MAKKKTQEKRNSFWRMYLRAVGCESSMMMMMMRSARRAGPKRQCRAGKIPLCDRRVWERRKDFFISIWWRDSYQKTKCTQGLWPLLTLHIWGGGGLQDVVAFYRYVGQAGQKRIRTFFYQSFAFWSLRTSNSALSSSQGLGLHVQITQRRVYRRTLPKIAVSYQFKF